MRESQSGRRAGVDSGWGSRWVDTLRVFGIRGDLLGWFNPLIARFARQEAFVVVAWERCGLK